MKTKVIDFLKHRAVLSIFFVYSVISAFCLIFAGDDYTWMPMKRFTDALSDDVGNGRYFTNIITYFMIKNVPVRIFVYTVVMLALFRAVSTIISDRKNARFSTDFLVAAAFFTLHTEISISSFRWISGFTNYVISSMLVCFYILYNKKLLEGEPLKNSVQSSVCCFILGFLSVLCVENVTLYCIVFSIFILIFCAFRYRKVFVANVTYFVGNILGTLLLFSNNIYSVIAEKNDDPVGIRYIELDFSDILMKLYSSVLHYFSKPFILLHIVIIISLLYANAKKFSGSSEKKPKYNLFFTVILCMYGVYEGFVFLITDFSEFDSSCKIYAFETALTFLYTVGIVYLSLVTFDKNTFIRICLYLCSAYFVSLPFLVVNPVTARCFFMDFIFWILLAGEIFISALRGTEIRFSQFFKPICIFTTASYLVIFSYTLIINKYVDSIRYDFINRQLERGSNSVELITLPYPNVSFDTISYLYDNTEDYKNLVHSTLKDTYYFDWICDCYDIDASKLYDAVTVEISIYDYNNEKDISFL